MRMRDCSLPREAAHLLRLMMQAFSSLHVGTLVESSSVKDELHVRGFGYPLSFIMALDTDGDGEAMPLGCLFSCSTRSSKHEHLGDKFSLRSIEETSKKQLTVTNNN
ncbi:hypothetical protein GW17_00048826 [Ensete ventricosum]|nr:hypothetical protein GW17_00048826 [Ensete ventricosum]